MPRHIVAAALLATLCTCATPGTASAQTPPAGSTRVHVERLASEGFAGRQAGSRGEELAADYLAAQLAGLGARPLPGQSDMFGLFTFTAGSTDAGSTLTIARSGAPTGSRTFSTHDEVQALSFSDDGTVSAPAVFAGYGIVVPEGQTFGYDSYAGLDVAGKVVVVLRYFPEDADAATRAVLARYSDLRYKAMAARQRGAKALIVVTGPRSPNAGRTIPMTFDTALAGSGLPAASVGGAAAAALMAGPRTLEDIQKSFDSGNPHVSGFSLQDVSVTLHAAVARRTATGRNVLAYLPATRSVDGVQKPWVALGAHYDHLGAGDNGNSLASQAEIGKAHPGADDNASGSAAVLAIAQALASQTRPRHLLLAFWSAEEIGLVGSSAFVARPPVPVDQIAAYLNFDMVGRMRDNKLTVQATGTSPSWTAWLERANVAAGFDLVLQPDPYQPTDVASFNQASVASLSFTTGAHADYHKPSDTAEKINYEDLDRIASMATALTRRALDTEAPPAFAKVEPSGQGASRTGVRVFTGTVPDYASNAKGLLLGDVVAGGPAAQAGLMKGDVIVEIAGQSIANIYDYTYALELLKIGTPTTVVFVRGGERRTTSLTPAARR